MIKMGISIFLFLTCLIADVVDTNEIAYAECMKISKTDSIIGPFGNRSMGGSSGTYVSHIVLALENVNLEEKKFPSGEVSIYEVCKKTLKISNNTKNNFILNLNKIVKQENKNGKLIVFTTIEELRKYH